MPKAEKVYENGIEKGIRYTAKGKNKESFTLRNFSTSSLKDGSKPQWTMDVPLYKKANGEYITKELKFE